MNIEVASRSNEGVDSIVKVDDQAAAERTAKALRIATNHMVCIVVDDERIKRWDRQRVVDGNRWRAVDVDDFETLGPVRQVQFKR